MQEQGIDMSNARCIKIIRAQYYLTTTERCQAVNVQSTSKPSFFITDRIEHGDMVVEWLPTDKMWVDINTKPKAGAGFRRDRAVMMNFPVELPDETLVSRKLAGILNHSNHSIASTEDVKAIDSLKTVVDTPKKTVRISEARPTH